MFVLTIKGVELRAIKFLMALLLMQTATASFAGWQYTEWGMSPSEVAAASKGAAEIQTGHWERELAGSKIGAMGTHISGEYTFDVNFHFTNGKLSVVSMTLIEGDRHSLLEDLLAVYGHPFDERDTYGITVWFDKSRNNRVEFLPIGASYTALRYFPLIDEGAEGL